MKFILVTVIKWLTPTDLKRPMSCLSLLYKGTVTMEVLLATVTWWLTPMDLMYLSLALSTIKEDSDNGGSIGDCHLVVDINRFKASYAWPVSTT